MGKITFSVLNVLDLLPNSEEQKDFGCVELCGLCVAGAQSVGVGFLGLTCSCAKY